MAASEARNAGTAPARSDRGSRGDAERRSGGYHIETWGCQMNVLDSDKLAGALEREGYERAAADQADVILLNTCSIREKAAEKVFSELGRLRAFKRRKPGLLLGVCGCVAQQEGERIYARAPYVDFVLGPRATGSLAEILARHRAGDLGVRRIVDVEYRSDSIDFPYDRIRREDASSGKAYVTIMEGCNHRCTYCVVPQTRGREVCREMDQVVEEVRHLAGRGFLEVEFLGQTVNAYRDGAGRTLGHLLGEAARVEGIRRVRFTTSHPVQMTVALIDAMGAARPTVCPYLHLPVQSGSTNVLKNMRRGYDRETYLRKIDALRQAMPGISFGTDIIVGFPGESEEDFQQTMSLLEAVRFDTVYSFAYSPRPSTKALELIDLPLEVKLERLKRLQQRQKQIQEERNAEWVGREVEVLVEGESKRDESRWTGRSPEHRVVNFDGEAAPGTLQRVRITGSTAFSLRGKSVPRRE
jgi:tRNA-2-methylthio-N6-dimethylallyladenosine synthase